MAKYCNRCQLSYEDGSLIYCDKCHNLLEFKKRGGNPESDRLIKIYKQVNLESELKHN